MRFGVGWIAKMVAVGAFLMAHCAQASTYFYPDITPVVTIGANLSWLKEGRGNDGYVSVVSEVIPASACVPLSNKGFWGGEKTQLVLSVTTTGFLRDKPEDEIPIATFDGRDDGSECATLSTTPINVVPLTLLGKYSSVNAGKLAITLNVKSARNSSQDYIGSAKLVLGAAAMVMTGGAASAIGGIAATVGNPVLSEAQSRTNTILGSMANAKSTLTLSWKKLRGGLSIVEFPVYRSDGAVKSTIPRDVNPSGQAKQESQTTLFTVRLTFNYVSSLFDPASGGATELSGSSGLSMINVLNSRAMHSSVNFMQYLNDASPSLLQSIAMAEGQALSKACGIGIYKLKKLNLSDLDTTIVMKSFVDEAKGGVDWYRDPKLVKDCFGHEMAIQAHLEELYGPSTPEFVIGDVQDGVGSAYKLWREAIGPTLADFRRALAAKQDQQGALIDFNLKQDIELGFAHDVQPWSQGGGDGAASAYAGIKMLAERRIRTIGCFIYKEATNLSVENPSAYFLMESEDGNHWVGYAKIPSKGAGRKLVSVLISGMTPDWARYFSSFRYPGGECRSLLERYQSSPLLTLPDGRNGAGEGANVVERHNSVAP